MNRFADGNTNHISKGKKRFQDHRAGHRMTRILWLKEVSGGKISRESQKRFKALEGALKDSRYRILHLNPEFLVRHSSIITIDIRLFSLHFLSPILCPGTV